jgi:tryptophan synthase alpha chain
MLGEARMSRLSERLAAVRAKGEKALVCYVVAGDPSLDATADFVVALAEAGVDAVELGIPFSDPLADGPTIQSAAFRSLQRGTTVPKALGALEAIRGRTQVPVVLMTYFNPVLRYGVERFARDAASAGADGAILTDLTPEESGEWVPAARSAGVDTVFLLAPTSTPDRVRVVADLSRGFVYCVSRTGVTGARDDVPADVSGLVAAVRAATDTPALIGFGISRPDQVRRVGAMADGVVVGSALVSLIAAGRDVAETAVAVRDFASRLKAETLPSASV